MRKSEYTSHWTWRSNSKTWLLLMKSWMSKAKTWMLHKSKLNVGCKKVGSRVQTQMTNAKCRIDDAKYSVKWNIEFWRKWNAISEDTTATLHAMARSKNKKMKRKCVWCSFRCGDITPQHFDVWRLSLDFYIFFVFLFSFKTSRKRMMTIFWSGEKARKK